MVDTDIGQSLDELLQKSPEELSRAYRDVVEILREQLSSHKFAAGPPLPDVSRDLDDDQRSVVSSSDSTLRLLAPAGAGKTHCIVNKVLSLMRQGIQPRRVLLVTFDNNSANELRSRARDLLGDVQTPVISTLNAYGRSLLSDYKFSKRVPRLINEAPGFQQKLVKDLLDQLTAKDPRVKAVLPTGVKRTYYLGVFAFLKNQIYSPRDPGGAVALRRLAKVIAPAITTFFAPLMVQVGQSEERSLLLLASLDWLFRSYEQAKDQAGYMDFDDQKLWAHELLRDHADVLRAVQGSYDWVVVDEFQDMNELDFRLILQVSALASLVVVGDDDQSIYGFRGTSPAYIIELERLCGRTVKTLELRRNYRCPENIVRHATALIRHNTYRVEKNPIPARPEHCDIRVYNALTPSAEAASIAEFIERLTRSGETKYRDIAVLYRMNSQSLPVQLELLGRGIPFYCRKEDNILGQDYLPRVLAILRVAHSLQTGDPLELTDFLQAVRGYFQFLRNDEQDRLNLVARSAGSPYVSCLDDPRMNDTKIGKSNVGAALRELAQCTTPLDALMLVGERFRGVRGLVGSLEDAVDNQLPLGELGDVAMRFERIVDFADYLDDAIKRARGRHTDDLDADSVRLLTYFRSKGAQFDTVILPSLNNGVIPHSRAPMEDERRLFYVAVTRTRRNLWLSYVKRICNKGVEVSPFLRELELPRSSWT